jgi:DNA-binding transcriptional LysR family regulator
MSDTTDSRIVRRVTVTSTYFANRSKRYASGVPLGIRNSLAVAMNGPLIVDDVEVLIQAAIDGTGLAFTLEERVSAHLANGALVRVLDDWCAAFAGAFQYYPSRALSALIDVLRI